MLKQKQNKRNEVVVVKGTEFEIPKQNKVVGIITESKSNFLISFKKDFINLKKVEIEI